MIRYKGHRYRAAGDLQQMPTWDVAWNYAQLSGEYELQRDRLRAEWINEVQQEVDIRVDETGRDEDDVLEEVLDESADEIQAELEQRYRERYQDLVRLFTEELQGQDCWRAVSVPRKQDPRQLDPLGVYWSFARSGAAVYDEGVKGGQTVVYRGRIDLQHVDPEQVFQIGMQPLLFDEAQEVSFHEGAPIWVYDVELPDGTVAEINDWRTT